jgi:hypothetical protein
MPRLKADNHAVGSSINAITTCVFPPAIIFRLMIPAVAADNKRWRILKHFPCDHIEASKLTHKLHILNRIQDKPKRGLATTKAQERLTTSHRDCTQYIPHR